MRLRITFVIVCLQSLLSSVAAGATPQTFLTLNSQPGDYIGGGITQTFTPADGTFSVSNSSDAVRGDFEDCDLLSGKARGDCHSAVAEPGRLFKDILRPIVLLERGCCMDRAGVSYVLGTT